MVQEIAVNNLLLDLMNYRLNNPDNQDDTLRQIIQDQKEKLFRLAADIARWGTNPSELSIVMAAEHPEYYIVLEGNRRLAAIKLLIYASEIDKVDEINLKEQFRELRQEYPQIQISTLPCIVVKNREEADHWIQLRHTGENQGVGTVKWNAEASSRFSHRMGKATFNSIAMKIVEKLQSSPLVNQTTKSKIEKLKLTNLARLMNDTAVRDIVGIQIKNGDVEVDLSRPEVRTKLERIIEDITAPGFNVHTIYRKTDRADYIKTLAQPSQQSSTTTNASEKGQDSAGGQSTTGAQQAKSTRSNPQSQARLTLIPSKIKMNIKHARLNKIYDELHKLEVDDYANCAAVMLRVFLELSIDEFSDRTTIPGYSPKSELYNKIKTVADYMEKNNILSAEKLKAIRVAANPQNKHSLFSTHTLNAYVHNPDMAPIPNELKIAWDRTEEFIVKLWE